MGEIGLDYYRDYAPRDAQAKLLHSPARARETRRSARGHPQPQRRRRHGSILRQWFDGTVVLHCFSSPALLGAAVEHDWYMSFAGNVTYKNAEDLREAARAVPAERIARRDGLSVSRAAAGRGKTNEPAYVVHTVAALAEARGEDPDELAAQIDANAAAAFALP